MSLCVSNKMNLLYVSVCKIRTSAHVSRGQKRKRMKEMKNKMKVRWFFISLHYACPNWHPLHPAYCTDWPAAAGRTWVSSWSARGGQSHTPWPERPVPPSGQGPSVTTSPWSSWWGPRHATPHQTRPPVRLLTRRQTGLPGEQNKEIVWTVVNKST